jgi:hypothetical protein
MANFNCLINNNKINKTTPIITVGPIIMIINTTTKIVI